MNTSAFKDEADISPRSGWYSNKPRLVHRFAPPETLRASLRMRRPTDGASDSDELQRADIHPLASVRHSSLDRYISHEESPLLLPKRSSQQLPSFADIEAPRLDLTSAPSPSGSLASFGSTNRISSTSSTVSNGSAASLLLSLTPLTTRVPLPDRSIPLLPSPSELVRPLPSSRQGSASFYRRPSDLFLDPWSRNDLSRSTSPSSAASPALPRIPNSLYQYPSPMTKRRESTKRATTVTSETADTDRVDEMAASGSSATSMEAGPSSSTAPVPVTRPAPSIENAAATEPSPRRSSKRTAAMAMASSGVSPTKPLSKKKKTSPVKEKEKPKVEENENDEAESGEILIQTGKMATDPKGKVPQRGEGPSSESTKPTAPPTQSQSQHRVQQSQSHTRQPSNPQQTFQPSVLRPPHFPAPYSANARPPVGSSSSAQFQPLGRQDPRVNGNQNMLATQQFQPMPHDAHLGGGPQGFWPQASGERRESIASNFSPMSASIPFPGTPTTNDFASPVIGHPPSSMGHYSDWQGHPPPESSQHNEIPAAQPFHYDRSSIPGPNQNHFGFNGMVGNEQMSSGAGPSGHNNPSMGNPSRAGPSTESDSSEENSPEATGGLARGSRTSISDNGGTMGSTPYARTPALKVSHKMAERKRRKEMKELFDELRNQLPADRGMKASKWEILSKAVDFINHIKRQNVDLLRENEGLRREVDAQRGGPSIGSYGSPLQGYPGGPPGPPYAMNSPYAGMPPPTSYGLHPGLGMPGPPPPGPPRGPGQ